MKNINQVETSNKIHRVALEIFKIYNNVVRTPVNWKEERERLLEHPDSRASWSYQIPDLIDELRDQIVKLKKEFDLVTQKDSTDIYQKFLPFVTDATIRTALVKCQILNRLQIGKFKSTLELRKLFYDLDYDYTGIEKTFSTLVKNQKNKQVGEKLGLQTIPAFQAAKVIRDSIREVRQKLEKVIPFLPKFKNKILQTLIAEVEVIDDPSFSMRCITDPKTLTTKILLNKRRKYSSALLKIAYLHEFCGHALEMAVFDKTLVKNKVIPEIYSYAGVSSPSIFDVKAEVLADLMVAPFVEKQEMKYVFYRRDVWLICRAMADYLYSTKGGTIKDVMENYESVGLGDFAFDEAIMASIFIDGYQGMYLFANQKIEELRKKLVLSDKELLSLLLYMGKVPLDKFGKFKKHITLNKSTWIR